MAEESLPLPGLTWTPSVNVAPLGRKRLRGSSPPFPSSDPPIFSSDDDPSIDNYRKGGRQKKIFRGPWYEQKPVLEKQDSTVHKKTRKFERKFDSGIFLASDDTDMSGMVDGITEQDSPEARLPSGYSISYLAERAAPEERARQHIEWCLENGEEFIDLSQRSLTSISNETIRPLGTFARVPSLARGVFTQLEPRLSMFLHSNDLTTLPVALFDLQHLTVLSLRGNQLAHLPPAIAKLTNLTEFNIAQNQLRYLPYELLGLLLRFKAPMINLQIHPNPFVYPNHKPTWTEPLQIDEANHTGRKRAITIHSSEDNSDRIRSTTKYRARTQVMFLDLSGHPLKGHNLPSTIDSALDHVIYADYDGNPTPVADEMKPPQVVRDSRVSRVPSLLEVALKACSKSQELAALPSLLPDDHPSHFPELLEVAQSKKDSGGSECTMCGRNFIIARTEWIEWWEISKTSASLASAASPLRRMENERDLSERMVPLIRRGCSWLCLPGGYETDAVRDLRQGSMHSGTHAI